VVVEEVSVDAGAGGEGVNVVSVDVVGLEVGPGATSDADDPALAFTTAAMCASGGTKTARYGAPESSATASAAKSVAEKEAGTPKPHVSSPQGPSPCRYT